MVIDKDEYVRQVAASIGAQLQNPRLISRLWRLLSEGHPVAPEHLASAVDLSAGAVREELAKHQSLEWDDEGRIVGLGLTLRETPHSFTFEGRTVFGWCATDILIFPTVLDKQGVAESQCPVTGRKIRVTLSPTRVLEVDPHDAVVSEVRPTERVSDLRSDICSLGLFFSSRDAGAVWLQQYPQGQLNSVEEDFEIHRQAIQDLGWLAK